MTTPTPPTGPSPEGGQSSVAGTAAAAGSDGAAAASTPPPAAPAATTPAQPAPLAKDTAAALQRALVADQAAVWAYDLVAAFDPADADTIGTIRTGHLMRRDTTAGRLTAGGVKPTPPGAAYTLPFPVTDAASAIKLAIAVENDCAQAWVGVIGSTDDADLRGYGLAGLSDAAVRMTDWKITGKINPPTVPFPGWSG